jgi:hypothetical protein
VLIASATTVDKALLQTDDALVKPFDLDALYETVSRLTAASERAARPPGMATSEKWSRPARAHTSC